VDRGDGVLTVFAPAQTIFSLLYQLLSAALITPLYWLILVLSSPSTIKPSASTPSSSGTETHSCLTHPPPISEAHAEAVTFAFFVGFFLPTSFMIFTKDPHVIAIWQVFPLCMLLGMQLHLLVRPPKPSILDQQTHIEITTVKDVGSDDILDIAPDSVSEPATGRKTLQALYGFTITCSTLAHLQLVFPLISTPALLRDALLPHIISPLSNATQTLSTSGATLAPSPTQVAAAVQNFLQWDGVFTYGSAIFAALFFARSMPEALAIGLWLVSTTVTMGPGAALGTVYAWREGRRYTKITHVK
jgi:hypothetical protein